MLLKLTRLRYVVRLVHAGPPCINCRGEPGPLELKFIEILIAIKSLNLVQVAYRPILEICNSILIHGVTVFSRF